MDFFPLGLLQCTAGLLWLLDANLKARDLVTLREWLFHALLLRRRWLLNA